MKVTVTGVSPHRDGLRLGLTVEHERAGWVRFTTSVLVVDRLSIWERESLMSALDHAIGQVDAGQDRPLF